MEFSREKFVCIWLWLNRDTMFYETLFVFMSVKQNLFVPFFVYKCLMMLNDVECTTSGENFQESESS